MGVGGGGHGGRGRVLQGVAGGDTARLEARELMLEARQAQAQGRRRQGQRRGRGRHGDARACGDGSARRRARAYIRRCSSWREA